MTDSMGRSREPRRPEPPDPWERTTVTLWHKHIFGFQFCISSFPKQQSGPRGLGPPTNKESWIYRWFQHPVTLAGIQRTRVTLPAPFVLERGAAHDAPNANRCSADTDVVASGAGWRVHRGASQDACSVRGGWDTEGDVKRDASSESGTVERGALGESESGGGGRGLWCGT